MSTYTTGPIMFLNQVNIESFNSVYDSVEKSWHTELPTINSAPGISSPISFSNYHISGTSFDVQAKSTTLTLQASNATKAIKLADLAAPKTGDLAAVSFDPSQSAFSELLSISRNPLNYFFFNPSNHSGTGTLVTPAYLNVALTNLAAMPSWNVGKPNLPVYLVQFTGDAWVPYTEIDGLPIQVSCTPLEISNPVATSEALKQGEPTNLKAPFEPLKVQGTVIEDPGPIQSQLSITSFVSGVPSLSTGQTTTLLAVFNGGSGFIDHGIGAVNSGVQVLTGPINSTTLYTLTVSNPEGSSITSSVSIAVI
jgi:hypothetical protein